MSLRFSDGIGQAETVVYEGVMPDGLTHTVRRQDGTRLNVHNAHPCLKMQADLTDIPQTPLDYCKELGNGIMREEAIGSTKSFNPSAAGADGLASLPISSFLT